jgi:hypothetical protein
VLARRTHELFVKHPWSLESLRNAEGGPNGLRHVEQSLAIAARTGLPAEALLELTALLDDYVFGHVMRTAEVRRSMGDAEAAMRRMEGLIGYFEALMETASSRTSRRRSAATCARASHASRPWPMTKGASSAGFRSCSTA